VQLSLRGTDDKIVGATGALRDGKDKDGVTEEDAYLKLRNESRRLRRPMRELAEAIILANELEKQRSTPAKPE
jgi:AmiR/NasT family two-component response regulator